MLLLDRASHRLQATYSSDFFVLSNRCFSLQRRFRATFLCLFESNQCHFSRGGGGGQFTPAVVLIYHVHWTDRGGCCCYCPAGPSKRTPFQPHEKQVDADTERMRAGDRCVLAMWSGSIGPGIKLEVDEQPSCYFGVTIHITTL
jgi:hypothetical protein